MENFRELRDASKLNKKPERIRLKTISNPVTLEQALKSYNVPASRMEELAILNGMQMNQRIAQGTMIKIIAE
jgi:predicted Zn-dependent protease